MINDIIYCAMTSCDAYILDGIFRSGLRRPDGEIHVPWALGRRLAWGAAWNATVVDTLLVSHSLRTSVGAGSAAS